MFSGCPTLLRSDYGTENVSLAKAQIAMRMSHDDHHLESVIQQSRTEQGSMPPEDLDLCTLVVAAFAAVQECMANLYNQVVCT